MSRRKRNKRGRNTRAEQAKDKPGNGPPLPVSSPTTAQGGQEQTLSSASSSQQCSDEHKAEGPTRAELTNWEARSHKVAVFEACVSVGLFALAVVGAAIGYYQWGMMRVQNETMISQSGIMISQQRPWIRINASAPVPPEVDYPLNVMLDMKNSGPTPGTVVEQSVQVIYFEPSVEIEGVGILRTRGIDRDVTLHQSFLDKMEADGPVGVSPFVVPPNDSISHGVTNLDPLDEELLRDINEGKTVPVLVVFIRYAVPASGTLNDKRTTWFCGVYNPKKREFTRTAKYNTMD